eukprot:6743810-Pyramimonas_sp.AAC.1
MGTRTLVNICVAQRVIQERGVPIDPIHGPVDALYRVLLYPPPPFREPPSRPPPIEFPLLLVPPPPELLELLQRLVPLPTPHFLLQSDKLRAPTGGEHRRGRGSRSSRRLAMTTFLNLWEAEARVDGRVDTCLQRAAVVAGLRHPSGEAPNSPCNVSGRDDWSIKLQLSSHQCVVTEPA